MREHKSGFNDKRNIQTATQVVPSELSESMTFLEDGLYFASLAALDRLRQGLRGQHNELWTAWALVVAAKNRFHLEDDPGANECLLAVPKQLLEDSPELSADHYSVSGLIARRRAHLAWKRGQPKTASVGVAEAITAFRFAQAVSFGQNKQLIRLNARMNEVYTEGLAAVIAGQSLETNPRLAVEAVKIEAEIRNFSPPRLRNDLTGMTIIADIARGAQLSVEEVQNLDSSQNARASCLAIFGSTPTNWPTLILQLARTDNQRPAINSQGLSLGATMLFRPQYAFLLPTLGLPYQVNLMHALLSLQKETQRETALTRNVREAIRKIDAVAGTRFSGQRVFR